MIYLANQNLIDFECGEVRISEKYNTVEIYLRDMQKCQLRGGHIKEIPV